jgi:hypothetical protein
MAFRFLRSSVGLKRLALGLTGLTYISTPTAARLRFAPLAVHASGLRSVLLKDGSGYGPLARPVACETLWVGNNQLSEIG